MTNIVNYDMTADCMSHGVDPFATELIMPGDP